MIGKNAEKQKEILLWIKKSLGISQKIIKMVEEDVYCVDIATQVNAAIGLLKSANMKLLENHLDCCGPRFLNAANNGKKAAFIKELVRTWNITTR